MLTVKVTVKPSSVQGLGLFADEMIPKGTVVWRYDPRFDLMFDPDAVKVMEPVQKELLDRYAYLSTTSGKYVYCADDGRFMNHSSTKSNIGVIPFENESETRGIANRDIAVGEELLIDYRSFDEHDAKSNEAYLKS